MDIFPFMLAMLWDRVSWSQSLLSPSLGVDYWYEVKPSTWRLRSDIGWWRWGGVDRKGGPERRAQRAVPSSYWCILFLMVLQDTGEPVSHL